MKKHAWVMGVLLVFLTAAFAAAGQDAEKQPVPAAFFPEKSYQFEPVLEGAEVTHEFTIQNKGTSELVVQRVQPG